MLYASNLLNASNKIWSLKKACTFRPPRSVEDGAAAPSKNEKAIGSAIEWIVRIALHRLTLIFSQVDSEEMQVAK